MSTDEIERLRGMYETSNAENDELRAENERLREIITNFSKALRELNLVEWK